MASLTTTGRRTGQLRSTPVTWFRDGDDIVTVAMYLGMERDPDWCLNLEASSHATIVIAGERIEVSARRTSGEERRRLWARWLEIQPISRRFEPIAKREIPIFRLSPLGKQPELMNTLGNEVPAAASQGSPGLSTRSRS